MELLSALGITYVAVIQFIVFVALFTYLTLYVFGPYVHAYELRLEKTKGSEVLAEEFQKKAVELHSEYQEKAREVHGHIHQIFQKNRSEALADFDRIVNQARQQANESLDKNRNAIEKAMSTASNDLQGQTSTMALSITNKLLGK